jgi:hypothetical protein
MNFVSERCAKENIILNVESLKYADYIGYTSLIGEFEKAFVYFQKEKSTLSVLVAEVFLNTRNFLIITNALFNPDEDNTTTVVGTCMAVVERFLTNLEDVKLLQNILTALREVMNMVLLFFGVIYSWVFLANPGGRVGGGVGLMLAFVGGTVYASSPAFLFVTSLVGLVAGGLIGSGGHDWYTNHRYMQMQQQMVQEYQKFMFRLFGKPVVPPRDDLIRAYANVDGELSLNVEQNK